MKNLHHNDNQSHSNRGRSDFSVDRDRHENNRADSGRSPHEDLTHSATSLLKVADVNGDGRVNITDIKDVVARHNSVTGDERYHPLYDFNADGKINGHDIVKVVSDYGKEVPLLDRQIALATQATMKYYGSDGQANAIADGYIPFTQEAMGHGIHYYNPVLANEVGNSKEIDIENPVGLNFDATGQLIAVFYIRTLKTLEPTPENPLAGLFHDPADDTPPSSSFDTLTADDWHTHESAWITGVGSLNSESVYYEEEVPAPAIISRIQETNFQLFPESDRFYNPKFWMLHGWFHSFNREGTFAITNPDIAPYALEELGVHSTHNEHDGGGHQTEIAPLIAGTDTGEALFGTPEGDRMSGFSGDDWISGGEGDDSVWGGGDNDWIRGDLGSAAEGGDDMLYGGPGNDLIYGNGGSDRLFGGTEDDRILGEDGDDIIRGGLGYDILTGGAGEDSFVLEATGGTDIITDLELEFDTIVLYGGITTETIAIDSLNNDTAISFNNETLAILSGVDSNNLIAAKEDIFLVA